MTAPKSVAAELAALHRMTVGELREKYVAAFSEETRSWNKDFLRKRIAWRIQELAEGGLSERARRRAEELARDADLRLRPPLQEKPGKTIVRRLKTAHRAEVPIVGTVLTREYRGTTIRVTVLENGFEHEGRVYRSLTAAAKAVTGSHWNGHHFFGLRGGRKAE
jgi:hypothetical protein